ncbi:sialidase-2-like [Ptychodera flava]|uniref:sialidase-2-like n=1 Tax=Ptychodera flava TaxID=63121 RepID=UPI00396A183A
MKIIVKPKKLALFVSCVLFFILVKLYWFPKSEPNHFDTDNHFHGPMGPIVAMQKHKLRRQNDPFKAPIAIQANPPRQMQDSPLRKVAANEANYKLPVPWNDKNVHVSELMNVFSGNEQGYSVARIPAMIFHDGKFLVFCEARTMVADFGHMAIISKRGSLLANNSIVWEDSKIVVQIPAMRTMSPTAVYDKIRNTVVLIFLIIESTLSERQMVRDGEHHVQVAVVKSHDFGKTWTKWRDITESTVNTIKNPKASAYAPGPGHGIQLKSGRLLIPGNHYQKDWSGLVGPKQLFNNSDYSNVIYSDDGGDTWQMGGILPRSRDEEGRKIFANEAQVAELDDGVIVMGIRTLDHHQSRAQAFSHDGGMTFSKAEIIPNLVEPGYKIQNRVLKPRVAPGCQASIVTFPAPNGAPGNKTWALFSNPASDTLRKFMSIRLSYDGCKTWSNPWTIYPWYSGYSDMTYLGNSESGPKFAIIYEGGHHTEVDQIMIKVFTLDAVLKGLTEKRFVFHGDG